MACGLACIAYDIPPNREALANGEAGILVPPRERARLTEAIVDLATRPGAARELGGRARRRASSTYDVDVIAARLETLYRGLVEERGGQAARKPE
jgi:glycosyltransferase involved in cell wall biosynthesis